MYNPAPQYAQFDAPSGKTGYRGATAVNEDSLPMMPGWDNAHSRKVEDTSVQEREDEGVELEKMDQNAALLPKQQNFPVSAYGNTRAPAYDDSHYNASGDLGMMHSSTANPYNDHSRTAYNGPAQGTGYPNSHAGYNPYAGYGQQSTYGQTNTSYAPQSHGQGQGQGRYSTTQYAPSVAAPSYHTRAPSMDQGQQVYAPVGRKPVNGSWRDL